MKIVLITTTQPSANPRLVKEADTFCNAGYDVTILYSYVADWAQMADKEILKNVKWNYIQIGGVNKRSLIYQWTRLKYGVYRKINDTLGEKFFSEKAHARCYKELLSAAVSIKADWYIGHNPGALAIAANAAKRNKAKAGFDFEDYHRGEYKNASEAGYKRQVFLEEKYGDEFIYISTASPLITQAIQADVNNKKPRFVTLLNTFPKKDQPFFHSDFKENQLKLFWFSQHIGIGRGLELLIECLQEMNDSSITLTLAGNYSMIIKDQFSKLAGKFSNNIDFCGFIAPRELSNFSSHFHVGLALEPARDINNDIALSNKIFTYLLAGNAIIFSETNAQKQFNYEYQAGVTFAIGNKVELEKCILSFKNKLILKHQRDRNFGLANEFLNWETESKKLIAIIN